MVVVSRYARLGGASGGTPDAAVRTTALPKKAALGASGLLLLTGRRGLTDFGI